MIIAEGKREDREYPLNAELLIRLYFPSLRDPFNKLVETRNELAARHGQFRRLYRREGPTRNYREERLMFISVIKRLDTDEEDLKLSICALADQLRG